MGNITFTEKLDFIKNCKCYGFEAIALVDSQYDLVELQLDPNIIQVGSVLVPSYDAINAYMDGNIQAFESLYVTQLASRECDEFISLIAYALFLNKNIAIYIGEDQMLVNYIDTLANYIINTFGIAPGVENENGYINPTYQDIWTSKFYIYGFINCEEFLSMYTPNINIMPEVLNKLVIDEPPLDYTAPMVLTSIENCNMYYMNLVKMKHGMPKSLYMRIK